MIKSLLIHTTAYGYRSARKLTNQIGCVYFYKLSDILSATVDGVSTNLYAYDVFGNMTNEVQNGTVIARDYDAFGRPTGYRFLPEGGRVALVATDPEIAVSYSYDALGRFASVSAGGSGDVPRPLQTFAYSYLPGTDLVSGYTCGDFSRSVSYEPQRNLISAVTNVFGDTLISAFDYTNDAAGRRISRLDTFDGEVITNLFGYNPRSEVTSATMGTNTYGYAYDPIGNRIEASHNAETNSYTANSLNQYIAIDAAELPSPRVGKRGQAPNFYWRGISPGLNCKKMHVKTAAA